MMPGTLYLIPTPLAEEPIYHTLSTEQIAIVKELRYFIVEDLRTARRFLRKCDPTFPIDDSKFFELNQHTPFNEISTMLAPLLSGHNCGIMSEAGMPCIADPGSEIVKLAHSKGIKVAPFPGPSSIFLLLAASGFSGQSFAFNGYLPVEKKMRDLKIKELEKAIYHFNQTQIFIETPYRNHQLLEALINNCQADTMLCIGRDLTSTSEWIRTYKIADWRKQSPALSKRPAIFALYK
jgi:16S rRNA (cytidine1402-2'-O)-methyltransferase